ncbi:hypothetical protein IscW_ISCW024029 [Ixodes scapularis]|uniref:Uncharacterized protein n=1 Tax=Ixodes scapularis TaxID=6945 RepID=B7P2X7_IXOSC|nr:hypothetical protein IscW_ISCW024029 [Ixodes scapularis]|eukprot:XP_002403104.1 hypothetical protein IscW_ISCW024029 [Ixodes scapularis]
MLFRAHVQGASTIGHPGDVFDADRLPDHTRRGAPPTTHDPCRALTTVTGNSQAGHCAAIFYRASRHHHQRRQTQESVTLPKEKSALRAPCLQLRPPPKRSAKSVDQKSPGGGSRPQQRRLPIFPPLFLWILLRL